MTKVVINGETFDYDGSRQPMSEALWIEHVYKRRYAEWQEDLQAGSAKAMCVLACLIWRRDGRDVSTAFTDLVDGKTDFDLNEMMQSMIDGATAAGAEDPTTTGEPPAPDGTPTTGTATSSSSPASSGSARGKSGSSKSGTSKP